MALLQGFERRIILLAQKNWRLVPLFLLHHFCGVCVSLMLRFPMERFYTRSIYFDMSLWEKNMKEFERSVDSSLSTQWSEEQGSRGLW